MNPLILSAAVQYADNIPDAFRSGATEDFCAGVKWAVEQIRKGLQEGVGLEAILLSLENKNDKT